MDDIDIRKLKRAAEKIKMPGDMPERIIKNCDLYDSKTYTKERKSSFIRPKFSLAAVIILCVCLTAVVSASFKSGYFKDVV
ncbi:MAG: hypothetical protein IJC39_04235 [Firmicutes bacterium]|nr:hypothetical protein [Bacillota bacterium]